ncbi:YqaJ viral recombinase family nuclease [Glaciimonas soli]|uniref:Endonuclease n=1 Tax=Glaciimonas soli TaxID=2590999 RepID=A0A843YTM8_9BURK|nr:YqaJ viral recombinase family protein [Glaciimonas soli]MQR00963.1 endonuclease [Glaciimonas soli]
MSIAERVVKGKSNRPALRLVSTKDLNRDDWLVVRKNGIGSSDAGAAVGLNPYQSQLELWMIKTGRDADLPKIDPNDDTTPAFFGTLFEPLVASLYTRRTGNKVRRINAVLQHPDIPFMLANIDREIIGVDDVQILECKTAGEFGSRLWRDGVPEYIQLQVQHQLAVTGKMAADICCLICGQEIRIYRIDRDDALIARLMELERQFWYYVETDTPPPADGSDSADVALRCLYPNDSGKTLDLTHDREMSAAFADLVSVRDDIAAREKVEAQLKQRIQQKMADATKAKFETGEVSFKRSKDGSSLDVTKLLQDQPDLLQRYPLTKPGSRRFLVST